MLQVLNERAGCSVVLKGCESVRRDRRLLSAERTDDRVVLVGQLLKTSEAETVVAGRQRFRLLEELVTDRTGTEFVQM